MVTVAILIRHGLIAILTQTAVALIDVLFELDPIVNLWPPVPGEAHIWNVIYRKESSHTLPHLTAPDRTSPELTRLNIARPKPALTTKAEPYLTSPIHNRT